jgi:hypothetical protein
MAAVTPVTALLAVAAVVVVLTRFDLTTVPRMVTMLAVAAPVAVAVMHFVLAAAVAGRVCRLLVALMPIVRLHQSSVFLMIMRAFGHFQFLS